MMDLQQEIYTEVRGMRGSVNELNIRVTSLEIEVRNLGKRANNTENCEKSRRWSRADKLKMFALGGGWLIAVAMLVLSVCHVI